MTALATARHDLLASDGRLSRVDDYSVHIDDAPQVAAFQQSQRRGVFFRVDLQLELEGVGCVRGRVELDRNILVSRGLLEWPSRGSASA